MHHKHNAQAVDEKAGSVGKATVSEGSMTRRDFLKYAGIAAAGSATAWTLPQPVQAAAGPASRGRPGNTTKGFWKEVQNEFVIDPAVVYMNIGTTGAMPKQVLENYHQYNQLAAYHPRTFESELNATFGLFAQREKLAAQFGCEAREICLSRNTTDGLDAVVYGLEFFKGDEILLTHHEHIAALSPLHVIRDRYGVVLKEVEIPVLETESADQFIRAFKKQMTKKTKAILFSHITYKTGTRLPAKALCDLAREYELISIVDGAHGPGMIPLDFHKMGCDFYAGPGHKWQCGPGSTGILYLRDTGKNLPRFWSQNSSMYTFTAEPVGNVRGEYEIGFSLQYRGQLNIPAQLAMVDACDMWEDIGRDKIEAYVCGLSAYCKQRIKEKFGGEGTFFCPDIPEFTTGLTSFNPFKDIQDGAKITDLVERLEKAGYQVRYTDFHLHKDDPAATYAVRISTHLFHDTGQIDGLVDAMYDTVNSML